MADFCIQNTGPMTARPTQVLDQPAMVSLESLNRGHIHMSIQEAEQLLQDLPKALSGARLLERNRLAREEARQGEADARGRYVGLARSVGA